MLLNKTTKIYFSKNLYLFTIKIERKTYWKKMGNIWHDIDGKLWNECVLRIFLRKPSSQFSNYLMEGII